jgi:hypothetical protein
MAFRATLQIDRRQQMNSFEPTQNRVAGVAGKFLCVTLVVSAFASLRPAPTFAASSRQSGYSTGAVDTGGVPISAERAAAVHECSVEASKYSFSSWQETQIEVYGECMESHGEVP